MNSDYSDGGGSDVGAVQENSQRRFVMATLWKMLLLELSFTSDCLSSAWSHIYTHTHIDTHMFVSNQPLLSKEASVGLPYLSGGAGSLMSMEVLGDVSYLKQV